jgi:hypothetical protein
LKTLDFNKLNDVIRELCRFQHALTTETNFFAVGGGGYLENPTSDLMALFMGGDNREISPWLAKALMTCLAHDGLASGIALDSVNPWRSRKLTRICSR